MTKEGKDGAKPELEISSLPGPGTYVPKQNAKGGGYLGDAPQSTLHGGVAGRGPLQANSDLRAPFYTYSSIADGSGGVPAPGAYGSEVSVGKQTSSKRKSAPSFSFGGRSSAESKPLDRSVIDKSKQGLPGPGSYATRSSVERQAVSTKSSAPQYSFGGEDRFADTQESKVYISQSHAKENMGLASPGPVYGHKHDSKGGSYLGDAPAFSFGSGTRGTSNRESYVHNPGPGEYVSKSSLGKQDLSAKGTSPEFSFGTSSRGESGKTNPVFLSSLHEMESVGRTHAAGPKYFPQRNHEGGGALGDSPAYRFGSDDRFTTPLDDTRYRTTFPGPSSYQSEHSIGRQVGSKKSTMPEFSFGTEERSCIRPPGKPDPVC
uniref:Uncharacterized protein n=1 Tax=Palpitomonas bilix TaxID=652834 RepID=A0A7S3GL82_9EUKA|mmetsp:Transcript_7965/g.20795  ORF Transcript_7965/g.20795 Transcript_7965/m.20795 type:complete len:375 (+) Transcript_7965:106-1230(+)